jgi:hypothetical protein
MCVTHIAHEAHALSTQPPKVIYLSLPTPATHNRKTAAVLCCAVKTIRHLLPNDTAQPVKHWPNADPTDPGNLHQCCLVSRDPTYMHCQYVERMQCILHTTDTVTLLTCAAVQIEGRSASTLHKKHHTHELGVSPNM